MNSYAWQGHRWNSDAQEQGSTQAPNLEDALRDLRRRGYLDLSVQLEESSKDLASALRKQEIRHPEKLRPDLFRAPGTRQRPPHLLLRAARKARVQAVRHAYGVRARLTRSSWTATEKSLFLRQLGVMLNAAVPFHRAFDMLVEQTENPTVRARLQSSLRITELVPAFSSTRLFQSTELAQIDAAMMQGNLGDVMIRIADQIAAAEDFAKKLRVRLSGPVLTLLFVALVFPLMGRQIGFLLDSLASLQPGSWTAPAARFLTSPLWLALAWTLPLVLLLVARATLQRWLKKAANRKRLLALPGLGPILTQLDLAVSLQMLAGLLESGLPLPQTLELTQRVSLLTCWSGMLQAARRGDDLDEGIDADLPGLGMLRHTVKVGQESGTLPKLCLRLRSLYENDALHRLDQLLSIAEPAVTLLTGSVIALACWFCFSPILKISSSL